MSSAEVAHLQFVLLVFSHAGTIGVDWEGVAKEHGIGYARNGAGKFKDIVKKYGYKFEQNTLKKADPGGDDGSSAPATPTAKKIKKTAGTPRSTRSNRTLTPKKRKVTEADDEDDGEDNLKVENTSGSTNSAELESH